ncbi:hypothetical protein [Pedobacter cryotolerans]|uniref:Uncharacterized protein n=1 Tax=Pedobacter cryotolerans TaxID=2571270 RepID=A0A4U1BVW0_9SPHI|nr:hypothetical protein [Pedobacter cryotolerans]TKB96535.1 hypothetical protein FA045_17900 [Pedobacter cryotolerans]
MAKQIKSESTRLKIGNIIHNVYFWLKDGISKTEEEIFALLRATCKDTTCTNPKLWQSSTHA